MGKLFGFMGGLLGLYLTVLIVVLIRDRILHRAHRRFLTPKSFVWALILLFVVAGAQGETTPTTHQTQLDDRASGSSAKKKVAKPKAKPKTAVDKTAIIAESKQLSQEAAAHADILTRLVSLTNDESAGDNGDYYWDNGKAQFDDFSTLAAGDARFTHDGDRSGTAQAILTYDQYAASKGSRQGTPLAPPAWPLTNPKVVITWKLTGRTYHGYLYNRSHSIGDSLLGKKSYDSVYNFTTGTRGQNVGADQIGGMRHAEEAVEHYWQQNPHTTKTVKYETTPVYQGDETMPRGSIVDIQSSDGQLDEEIVVINSAEGQKIDYTNGTSSAQESSAAQAVASSQATSASSSTPAPQPAPEPSSAPAAAATQPAAPAPSTATVQQNGGWYTATNGQVFVSQSGKFYHQVTNPGNYAEMSEQQAINQGYVSGKRANQYARP